MTTQISVPIDTQLFLRFANDLRDLGSDSDPVKAIEEFIDCCIQLAAFLRGQGVAADLSMVAQDAIGYWIDNASWKQDDLLPAYDRRLGYTWKHKDVSLFLPAGTDIRMRYQGKYHYAKVEGDEIVYEGKSLSPANLAATIAGSSRNAWRDLWIRRPTDPEWKLADDLRQRLSGILQGAKKIVKEGDL